MQSITKLYNSEKKAGPRFDRSKIQIGTYCLYNTSEERIISNNRFWDGVLSFCINAKEFIKQKKPEKTHLFYRGPAEGAFVIGQYAKEWGECTVYEFNFGAAPREQKYIKGITI